MPWPIFTELLHVTLSNFFNYFQFKGDKTPLVYAYENGLLPIVRRLESRGCSLDEVSFTVLSSECAIGVKLCSIFFLVCNVCLVFQYCLV